MSAPRDTAPATGLTHLVTVASTGSTNDDLVDALSRDPDGAQERWPHLSALRARQQVAGRGRAGRRWVTPAAGALTVSVVLRPLVRPASLPWLPLVAGLAVRDALTTLVQEAGSGWTVATKWPNDVLLLPPDGESLERVPGWGCARKVGGLLTQVAVPAAQQRPAHRREAAAVVLGVGVNVSQGAPPVPWAGSLALAGVGAAPEEVLERVGAGLAGRLAQWERDEAAAAGLSAGLRGDLRAACTTLGQRVRAELPGGRVVEGMAVDVEPGLVLETTAGRQVVGAGDVLHLRAGEAVTPD